MSDHDNFFGDLLGGLFVVGGLCTLLDCAESFSERNRAEAEAIRRQQRQQREIEDLRKELNRLKTRY